MAGGETIMNDQEVRQAIEAALKRFPSQPLADAALHLLEVLGYTSKKRLPLQPNTLHQFPRHLFARSHAQRSLCLAGRMEDCRFPFPAH